MTATITGHFTDGISAPASVGERSAVPVVPATTAT